MPHLKSETCDLTHYYNPFVLMIRKHILLLGNQRLIPDPIFGVLKHQGYRLTIQWVENTVSVDALIPSDNRFDIILCQVLEPEKMNYDLLTHSRVREKIPVVFFTPEPYQRLFIDLVKHGAWDCVRLDDTLLSRLPEILDQAQNEWRAARNQKDLLALQKSPELKYRLLTQYVRDFIWEYDLENDRYGFVSETIKEFLGYNADEFSQMALLEVVHKSSLPALEEKGQELIRSLERHADPESLVVELEVMFVHKNGQTRWGAVRCFPVTGKNLKMTGLSGTVRDISGQKEAEQELKIQEAYFETLIREAPMAIVILDNADKVCQVNNQIVRLFEFPEHECIGKPVNELIVPDDRKDEGYMLTLKASEGGYINHETRRQTKSGRIIDVQILGKPVVLQQSQLGVFGIYLDISQRKGFEKQLRSLSERLLLATKMASIGIWDYDVSRKAMVWNAEMHQLHGLQKNGQKVPLEEVWRSVLVSEEANILDFLFDPPEFDLDTIEKVYRIRLKDGNIRHIRMFASVHFDSEQKPTRIVGCCFDITNEIKNAELSQKMEIATKVTHIKEQFLANMSHEIRSPLTGVLGMVDLLLKTRLDKRQQYYAEIIKKSSDGLLNIVNDILDISKIEAGRMKIRPKVYNLKESAYSLFGLFRAVASQKGLSFTHKYDPSLPEYVCADENRIAQIVTNLISNAIKFTQEGFVRLHYTKTGQTHDLITVRVDVEDSGIGISEQDQSGLFEMFSQLDNTDTRTYEGTGLGLSISRKLADLMDARIELDSMPGKGSTFSFVFDTPRVDHHEIGTKQPEKSTSHESNSDINCHVLLAEDQKTNQMVISLMLKNIGCTVDFAANGLEAIEKIHKNSYDVVFMDIQMPVMDGLTAVKKIREEQTDRNLPVIIGLSAKAMEGDAEYYIAQGMDDYLTKPVDTKLLRQSLIKWRNKSGRYN